MATPQTEATVRRRPRDRKDRIVFAAAARFGGDGFRATGLEEIAADVGVTAGAIYRHFESKEEILATVVAKAVDELLVTTERGVDGVPPRERLHALVSATVSFATDNPALYATFVREGQRLTGRSATAVRRREARVAEHWRQAVRDAALPLDDERVTLRQRSLLAALREIALSAEQTDLQRHTDLVADAFMAVWASPSVDTAPRQRNARAGFRAPVLRSQQILDAALTLFRERGFHDVGMEDIAASVGMVASGIYRFYPSKADILLDAYDLVLAHVIAGIDTVFAGSADARDALGGLIDLQARTALSVIDLIVVTEREGSALPEAERPRLVRRRRQILETHVSVLREVRPELGETEARLLFYGLQPLLRAAAAAGARLPDPVGELSAMGLALLGLPRR